MREETSEIFETSLFSSSKHTVQENAQSKEDTIPFFKFAAGACRYLPLTSSFVSCHQQVPASHNLLKKISAIETFVAVIKLVFGGKFESVHRVVIRKQWFSLPWFLFQDPLLVWGHHKAWPPPKPADYIILILFLTSLVVLPAKKPQQNTPSKKLSSLIIITIIYHEGIMHFLHSFSCHFTTSHSQFVSFFYSAQPFVRLWSEHTIPPIYISNDKKQRAFQKVSRDFASNFRLIRY